MLAQIFLKHVIFHRDVDGFSNVEYLIVFNAIICGFITSMYLTGWGNMIQNRKRLTISIEHLGWTIFSFVLFVSNWYGAWHRVEFINLHIGYFFYTLLPILLYYFISALLFPSFRNNGEDIDFQVHLDQNKRGIFGVYAVYFMLSIVSGLVYFENDLIDTQNIIRLSGVLFASFAMFTKKRGVHLAFLIGGFIMLVVFFLTIPAVTPK